MSRLRKILLVFAIIFAFIAVLWMVAKAIIGQMDIKVLIPRNGERFVFDYVIVGAGTSGSVVASLLSQRSNATVLLLEAGNQFGLLSRIPLLSTLQQKGLNDWAFLSVPQRHSSHGLINDQQCLPRGKGLGGSSQLNYMLHFDGCPQDFEKWQKIHNLSNWGWGDFEPFLKAAQSKPYELMSLPRGYSRLYDAFQNAIQEFSHKTWNFRKVVYNIKNGLRYVILERFLHKAIAANRGNLHIMTNALAKRIELVPLGDIHKVRTLMFYHGGQYYVVEVRRELILSAGAYQSPQLLLASGIGQPKALKNLRIKTIVPSSQVGRNLHDHLNFPLFVSLDVAAGTLNQHTFFRPMTYLKYMHDGSGPLGNFGVLGHIDDMANMTMPISLALFGGGAIDESMLMSISNYKRSQFRQHFPRYYNASQEGFVVISTCLQPQSRGNVKISSIDTRKHPLIDPNYLAEIVDVNCTIKAIRTAVELITGESFAALGPKIHWPRLKECQYFGPFDRDFRLNTPTDRYLECVIRHVGLGSHHPGGTCAMGVNPNTSVIDGQFRLHGVNNLRVVDASVLPTPISGNPNTVITALSVRAATMMLKDLRLSISTD